MPDSDNTSSKARSPNSQAVLSKVQQAARFLNLAQIGITLSDKPVLAILRGRNVAEIGLIGIAAEHIARAWISLTPDSELKGVKFDATSEVYVKFRRIPHLGLRSLPSYTAFLAQFKSLCSWRAISLHDGAIKLDDQVTKSAFNTVARFIVESAELHSRWVGLRRM